MPGNNPYSMGALGGNAGAPGLGALSNSPMMGGQMRGPGADPYAGIIQYLQQQHAARDQRTTADAMTKLRQLIANMPKAPAAPQVTGALGAMPTGPVAMAPPSDVYAPDDYINGTARIETGGRPDAATVVNPDSGATGKYQFIEKTWNDIIKQAPHLGLTPDGRTDVDQQEKAMRYLTAQNAPLLKTALGRMPTHSELYLAHLLGPGYASSVLKAPDTPVEALVPESFVKANPMLKGVTGSALVQLVGRKFNP